MEDDLSSAMSEAEQAAADALAAFADSSPAGDDEGSAAAASDSADSSGRTLFYYQTLFEAFSKSKMDPYQGSFLEGWMGS